MGLFQAFDISASGMTAERFRMDTIAQNIALAPLKVQKRDKNEDGRRYTISEKDRYICRKDRNTFFTVL